MTAWGSVCPPSLLLKKLRNKPVTFVSDLIKLWDVEEESECMGQCMPGAVIAWGQCVPGAVCAWGQCVPGDSVCLGQ